jgi:hypothetical protein
MDHLTLNISKVATLHVSMIVPVVIEMSIITNYTQGSPYRRMYQTSSNISGILD